MKKRPITADERRLFEKTIAASRPIAPAMAARRGSVKPRKNTDAPEARLDLHGMTEDAAHRALLGFVRGAQKKEFRRLLVITGKGLAGGGALKRAVPRWLKEKQFAALVRETRAAHRRDGGEGALMVYLRR